MLEPQKTDKKHFLFGDLKKSVTPGDNYDALDLYGDYVSPSRSGIQPTGTELGTETARLTNAQISQAQAANEAIQAAGLTPAPIDVAGIQKAAMEQAATNLAPSAISKYAPLAAIGTGTALAADYATDGAVLGMFTDDDGDGLDDTTGYTMEDYKVMFPNAFMTKVNFMVIINITKTLLSVLMGQAVQQSYMGPITGSEWWRNHGSWNTNQ